MHCADSMKNFAVVYLVRERELRDQPAAWVD
jgi:hypothetical protein